VKIDAKSRGAVWAGFWGRLGAVWRGCEGGVTLIIGPFNGPLILLLDPAITALSAGNPCILKLAESIPATSTLLQKLIPKYFEPESVEAVFVHMLKDDGFLNRQLYLFGADNILNFSNLA
jgi:hypothetical protein